ncbi:S46 family peptidase [Nemorincola caseinilytica]|uniref:Dipeptidyl-peptidase n=1 Tax=Nemorincola caseinilytica TaxID=2054315 RepID=A0ABP8NNR7_9BACT
MKKLILLFAAVASLNFTVKADEGMWIPMLIGKNYDEMQRLGLRLSKDDIYNINHSSLKDAILQFGGGCTAEMISDKGLLLTNHHCGYDAIANLSSVERNLLDNGFWARSMDEELPAKGVTALFLQRMEDVTAEVLEAVGDATGEEYNKKVEAIAKKIEERSNNKGKLTANVKSYFNGNQFLLLIYKRYTDVRLVGTPPKSLGKFGGDTDNWMWPRHTADFSMFRIYADKDNQPAGYSADNVPYRPKKYLPVSSRGVREGDYAMIMGYPGRTNRYEVSYGVDLAVRVVNPSIVDCRDLRLKIMKQHMDKDKKVYLQLTSSYSRIANYWKYYIGQTEQLQRLDVVNKKRTAEEKFMDWQHDNNKNTGLMGEFEKAYTGYEPYAKHAVYYSEAFRAPALTRMAASLKPLYDAYERHHGRLAADTLKKYITQAQNGYRAAIKDYERATDKELFAEMTRLYYINVPRNQHPAIYSSILNGASGSSKAPYVAYANTVFSSTFLTDSNRFNAFCKAPSYSKLKDDAAMRYTVSFVANYSKNYQPKVEAFANKKGDLAREYVKQLMQMNRGKKMYPDANSTMRVTYGKVLSYEPLDGVEYNYFTTLDGLVAKYKPNDDEFDAPKELLELHKKKNYGRWADADGSLHTCFITNNDITGGNSGSPVINANGELIGTAFDGNWEAMSGDIAFDKKYKRTIVCDIRFVLFLVDKLGHADNLIREMNIR